ncbi:MAG: homoserine dehydrogenase [Kiritimatiellae bacterium]|nr:homoserine dehydrogenase [Kiritimatiellia bacterium]
MKEIGVGLLGFGTIGAGVVDILQNGGELLAERAGLKLTLRRIADIDIKTDRGVPVDPALLTTDAESVIADPGVDVIVELIGGTTIAKTLICKSIAAGKPVVTANKALLAEHGAEIWALAAQKDVDVSFEAAVCGGIPLIRALREGLVANRIASIVGILNGTCNYILTRMERDRLAFDTVLKQAQESGYAEADPSLDIDGIDTAHKATILASLAYGFQVPMGAVHTEGIRGLAPIDIEYALDLGYRIKLLAVIRAMDGEVAVHVHPTLIALDHLLASVGDVFNAVLIDGERTGPTLYYGKGAGRYPTASAVVGDVVDLARNLAFESPRRVPVGIRPDRHGRVREMGGVVMRHYLRVSLLDKPGVFGQLGTVLGKHGVSIASVLQKEVRADAYVPVVIVTHRAAEKNIQSAIDEIDATDITGSPTVRIRIEDF